MLKQMPRRRHAAADPELQRLDGADPPARAVRRRADRTATRDLGGERGPHAAGHRAGRGDPVSRIGGKQRQIQIDLDPRRCRPRPFRPDVANALAAQNLITARRHPENRQFEYTIQLNNAPSELMELGDLPIKTVNGAMVYVRDVAQVRDGNPPQTNIVHVEGSRSVLMQVLKNGSVRRWLSSAGIKDKLREIKDSLPDKLKIALLGDQSLFVRAAIERRGAAKASSRRC